MEYYNSGISSLLVVLVLVLIFMAGEKFLDWWRK